MAGTSLDGEVDVALIETDGHDHVKALGFKPYRYDPALRDPIRAVFGRRERDAKVLAAEKIVTDIHIEAVKASGFAADVIGFHGQTVFHEPAEGITLQIGDGQTLAEATGIDVVCDFRSADVKAGGQGAPLIPLYHQALARAKALEQPAVFLNIGGVANVTYIDRDTLLAFDTGPGNALMDDYTRQKTGKPYDAGGALAASGSADEGIVARWMTHPYFTQKPPKSLDRNEWDVAAMGPLVEDLEGLSTEDALATLMEFTAQSIVKAAAHMPETPKRWYACGGGAHNATLMVRLARDISVAPCADIGINGDALEAEGFAYLAVRSLLGLPISLPETTGAPKPLTGGILHRAA